MNERSPSGTAGLEAPAARPELRPLVEAFHAIAVPQRGVGAGLCAYVDGRLALHETAGHRTADGSPWTPDTSTVLFSCSKALAAATLQLLIADGTVAEDQPIADIWPEFGAVGKDHLTIGDLLRHRIGLIDVDEPYGGDIDDPVAVAAALARTAPQWDGREGHGYHVLSFGWMIGEIVRRATGTSLSDVLHHDLGPRQGAAVSFGAPPGPHAPVALLDEPSEASGELADLPPAVLEAFAPGGLFLRALTAPAGTLGDLLTDPTAAINDPRIRDAEIAGATANGSAHGLARSLARLATGIDQAPPLLGETDLRRLRLDPSDGTDRVLFGEHTRFAGGFQLRSPAHRFPSETAFGHYGFGGSFAFVDPEAGLSLAFVTNGLSVGFAGDRRAQVLLDALEQCPIATRSTPNDPPRGADR